MAEASVLANGQMACITKKILLEGTLSLDSPLLIGTGLTAREARQETDMQVLKDKKERPFIPGTSLAGVLRMLLADEDAALLFGSAERGGRKIVLSVLVEEGGFGGRAAAGIARQIIRAYFEG